MGRVGVGPEGPLQLFLSTVTSRLDAKGRVSIPAAFRAVLNRDGFEGLFTTSSLETPAIDCGGHKLLGEIEALLDPLSKVSKGWAAFATTLLASSEVLKIDGEGRISLTDAIRAQTGIASEVTFVGMGHKFQIWEPARFRAYLDEAKAQVREALLQVNSPTAAGARSS